MRVNKAELAQILGCSLPTISAYMVRFGDAFPVLERGGKGRDWWFESESVVEFLESRRAAEAEADTERQAALRQLSLPMGHNGGPPIEAGQQLRPAELLMMAKLRKMQRDEAYECGRLLEVTKVVPAVEDMHRELNRDLHRMVRAFGREHGFGDDLMAALDAALSSCQRDSVRRLQSAISVEEAQPSLFAHAAA